jgi:cyclase
MNNIPRLIARMDIINTQLIKSIRYEGLNVIGPAKEYTKKYYEDELDEIIYIDTVASLYGRNTLEEIVDYSTKNIFIPICVGGGIQSIEMVKNILNSGADKICINSYAVKNPNIIKEISNTFGSQCTVISVQAKKRGNNKWEVFTDNGREPSNLDVMEWSKVVEEKGAGEILITSIDNDGTELGLDHDLLKNISNLVSIPIIASGGSKDENDIIKLFNNTKCSGVAIGSALHNGKINITNLKRKILGKL